MSARNEVKVEHPVTLYAYANDTDSEDPFLDVVDIYWPNAICEEGYYTRVCTTTAMTEGWHTFQAVGVDDDSAMTMASIDIRFTNINPHGLSVTMTNEWPDSNGCATNVARSKKIKSFNCVARHWIPSMIWMD